MNGSVDLDVNGSDSRYGLIAGINDLLYFPFISLHSVKKDVPVPKVWDTFFLPPIPSMWYNQCEPLLLVCIYLSIYQMIVSKKMGDVT